MSYFRTGIVAAAGDVTVSDPSGTIASTTVNAALTELSLRSPFVPGQFAVVCIDYDGRVLAGNDTTGAIGIGSTLTAALNAAKLTPFKTYERAAQIIPSNGNGAFLYVLGKGRTSSATYRNMANTADQTAAWRSNLKNYGRFSCRSTGDFSDTTADRIGLGFVPVSGTNAGGYNPTGVPTNNTFTCQLNGGGAAGLPTEINGISTITGYRIRFDAATATVALRNQCSNIWTNAAAQITVGANLPAVPTTSDIFYIETTELQFGSGTCIVNDTNASIVSIAGERWTASSTINGAPTTSVQFGGCEATSTVSIARMGSVSTFVNVIDPSGAFVSCGTGGRWAGAWTVSDMSSFTISQMSITTNGMSILRNVNTYSGLGSGSVIATGFQDANGGGNGSSSVTGTQLPIRSIGSLNVGTSQKLRIPQNGGFGAGIVINSQGCAVRGVDINNQTVACVMLGGTSSNIQGEALTIDDVVSTVGGNTGAVLKLNCHGAQVLVGTTVAITATAARDIDLSAGAVSGTFAGLATTNYFDSFGNNVVGSGGHVVDKPGKIYTNRTATAAIGQILRSNATSGECTIAKADSAANAASILGVAMTGALANVAILVAVPGSQAAVQFDSAPTAGNIGYLSTANVGNAQGGAPAAAGSNQKNRLGVVAAVSGSFGIMTFNPDKLAITADGAA